MKTILCFGDSNTWGYNPENRQRFGPDERWTGILRNSLGEDYRVIEEGLNGRTTLWESDRGIQKRTGLPNALFGKP